MGQFVFFLLVQLSFFAAGAALFSLITLLRYRPKHWWGLALSKTGLIAIVSAVLFGAIIPAGTISFSVLAGVYLAGLICATIGVTIVALDIIKKVGLMQVANLHPKIVLEEDPPQETSEK